MVPASLPGTSPPGPLPAGQPRTPQPDFTGRCPLISWALSPPPPAKPQVRENLISLNSTAGLSRLHRRLRIALRCWRARGALCPAPGTPRPRCPAGLRHAACRHRPTGLRGRHAGAQRGLSVCCNMRGGAVAPLQEQSGGTAGSYRPDTVWAQGGEYVRSLLHRPVRVPLLPGAARAPSWWGWPEGAARSPPQPLSSLCLGKTRRRSQAGFFLSRNEALERTRRTALSAIKRKGKKTQAPPFRRRAPRGGAGVSSGKVTAHLHFTLQ